MYNILGNSYIVMNGTWEVDAVKGAFCTNMSVTGPSSQEAWAKAKQFGSQGVTLSLGTCASQAIQICRLLLPRRSLPEWVYGRLGRKGMEQVN